MTIDGIPETLPPVAETAARPQFAAAEPRLMAMRRRPSPESQEMDDGLDEGGEESHVLDDLL